LRRRRVASGIGQVPAERIGEPVVDVEERAHVDRVFDGFIRQTGGSQGRDIGGSHLVGVEGEFLEKPERRAQLRVEWRRAPIVDDRLYEPLIL